MEAPVVPNPNSELPSPPSPVSADPAAHRPSAQLARWSRTRALRAGRRVDRPVEEGTSLSPPVSPSTPLSSKFPAVLIAEPEKKEGSPEADQGEGAAAAAANNESVIYMVSDGTGSTLEHAIRAALGQFENRRRCAVSTHLFSGINDVDNLLDIVRQAAKEGALLLYTLSDPALAKPAKQACQMWNVPFVDILGPTTEAIASQLGISPSGIPRSERKTPLTAEYFSRIEAIEFTIKQDDGAQPQNLNQAHMVLLGVSRSGKTPLSIYLAQKGYKVANVPIVMGVDLPKSLFQVSQEKIYALTINPAVLHSIRTSRATSLGFSNVMKSNYSVMDHVRQELDFASRIYSQNPLWPVIDVTGKAIEEIAAVVMRIYHDRKQKSSMPGIFKRY